MVEIKTLKVGIVFFLVFEFKNSKRHTYDMSTKELRKQSSVQESKYKTDIAYTCFKQLTRTILSISA